MKGFGVHTSMWTMSWDQEGCEHAVAKACSYEMDFLEIALPTSVLLEESFSNLVLIARVSVNYIPLFIHSYPNKAAVAHPNNESNPQSISAAIVIATNTINVV